ncbi:HNH endonuclease [Arthrobacter sp. TMN-50]
MDGRTAPALARKGYTLPRTAPRGAPGPKDGTESGGGGAGCGTAVVGSTQAVAVALRALKLATTSAGLIDQLRGLEDVKSAIAGVQARIVVAVDLVERAAQTDAGIPVAEQGKAEQGKSIGVQVALARRESPSRGSRLLGLARALVTEMPHTLAALEAGELNEWRATLLVKETACLSSADRTAVDEELAADAGTFTGCGDKTIIAAARAAAYRRDPRSVVNRAAHAANERYVSLRPAPDTMAYLTALLPVKNAVAAYAALTRHADTARAAGDTRSKGQLMADTLVERITGVAGGITRVEVQVIMTDRALFQGDSEPARIPGYGIVPSSWARDLLHPDPTQPNYDVWVRRLYTAPATGDLVAMDARARFFTRAQRRFISARDDTCRTPYCDAPIRHYDHIVPWNRGGRTSIANGAGLCEACNHTKETPGWTAQPRPGPGPGSRHTFRMTTPTGHTYHSTAPPLPGTGTASGPVSGPESAHREGPPRLGRPRRRASRPHV